MSARTLLVANWKMNLGISDSVKLARDISSRATQLKKTSVWLAPSFTAISSVKEALSASELEVGAQNVSWADSGAFTGEVSVAMLKEAGAQFVIVGHSERRHIFDENDVSVVKRAVAAAAGGLHCIFCVGEKLEDRERALTNLVLERQLTALIDGMQAEMLGSVILAYEPVWAIGTGRVAEVKDIAAAHAHLATLWNVQTKRLPPRILYGGSVAPDNFHTIINLQGVSGALVGGASLSAEKFCELIKISEAQ